MHKYEWFKENIIKLLIWFVLFPKALLLSNSMKNYSIQFVPHCGDTYINSNDSDVIKNR